MMQDMATPRNTRYESRTLANTSQVQKLTPVMAMLVETGEGGIISQDVTVELDPIPGRLLTMITAEVTMVFVPVQAIDALIDPTAAYAGMTEVIREKLISGNPLFTTETTGEIAQRCGIKPKSVAGVKTVNRMVRIGHNAAVNFLRVQVHKDAVQLAHTNTAVTPALLGSTVLTRLNGVLDPDDRINGAVALTLPQMILPVEGITQDANTNSAAVAANVTATGTQISVGAGTSASVRFKRNTSNPGGTDLDITATLNAVTAGNVSLTDFYQAETMDRLTRVMGKIMDDNPEYGQEMVLRWAHGLSVEAGNIPFIMAKQTKMFGQNIVSAMDTAGVQAETIRSDMAVQFNMSVPIPRTELGGMIYTFLSVKPDETLASQPHPVLTDAFGARNHVADQLAIDPQPVIMRQLDSNIAQASETTVALYTGKNELLRNYVDYGFGDNVVKSTLANKMAIWQLEIPLSVTPTTVLHPATPDQSIFANTTANVVRYTCAHRAVVKTPIFFGPSPVETLPIINSSDIFNEVP